MSRTSHIFLVAALLIGTAIDAKANDLCGLEEPTLIYASCRNPAPSVELMLLPEDAGATPRGALDISGAYTAPDRRRNGSPKPVGLYIRGGEIVSREYVRFDGVLSVVDGRPRLYHRRAVRIGGRNWNLDNPANRAGALAAAAAGGGGLLQSHLVIIDGAVDAHPRPDAPRFRRRILFETDTGAFGVFDSSPRPLTLNEAAEEVAARFAPHMALNLDMGSFNFCRRGGALCGTLPMGATGKLSNLIRLR